MKEEWIRIMEELEDHRQSIHLADRIHAEILVKAMQFTEANASQFATGTELLGKLLMAHTDYVEKHGWWGDMFGDYMILQETCNRRCGQVLTPTPIAEFMAKMALGNDDLMGKPKPILDPCAGTGRFMLVTAKHYAETCGQLNFVFYNVDIDHTVYTYCVMNAILKGIPSVNLWGDSLKNEYSEGVITVPTGRIAMWKMLSQEQTRGIISG